MHAPYSLATSYSHSHGIDGRCRATADCCFSCLSCMASIATWLQMLPCIGVCSQGEACEPRLCSLGSGIGIHNSSLRESLGHSTVKPPQSVALSLNPACLAATHQFTLALIFCIQTFANMSTRKFRTSLRIDNLAAWSLLTATSCCPARSCRRNNITPANGSNCRTERPGEPSE